MLGLGVWGLGLRVLRDPDVRFRGLGFRVKGT